MYSHLDGGILRLNFGGFLLKAFAVARHHNQVEAPFSEYPCEGFTDAHARAGDECPRAILLSKGRVLMYIRQDLPTY